MLALALLVQRQTLNVYHVVLPTFYTPFEAICHCSYDQILYQ